MKRLLLPLVLAAALFALPSIASALDLLEFQSAVDAMRAVDPTLDPPPNDGRHDFVVGGFSAPTVKWSVSAHSGPLGEEPFGHVNRTIPQPSGVIKQSRWRVTCVYVSANLAVVVGVPHPHAGSDDFNSTTKFYFRNGGPGGAADGFLQSFAASPVACGPADLVFAAAASPFANGNILVHDALPQP